MHTNLRTPLVCLPAWTFLTPQFPRLKYLATTCTLLILHLNGQRAFTFTWHTNVGSYYCLPPPLRLFSLGSCGWTTYSIVLDAATPNHHRGCWFFLPKLADLPLYSPHLPHYPPALHAHAHGVLPRNLGSKTWLTCSSSAVLVHGPHRTLAFLYMPAPTVCHACSLLPRAFLHCTCARLLHGTVIRWLPRLHTLILAEHEPTCMGQPVRFTAPVGFFCRYSV